MPHILIICFSSCKKDFTIDEEKIKILKRIEVVIENYRESKDDKKYVDILFENRLPDNYTGYRKPDMEKM